MSDIANRMTTNRVGGFLNQARMLLVLIALVVIFSVSSPYFLNMKNIFAIGLTISVIGIVCIGQSMILITGAFDLSVGGMVSFTAFLAGNLMQQQDALLAQSVVLVLGVGLATGLVSGLGVTLLRIPPLVMTLGMLGVV